MYLSVIELPDAVVNCNDVLCTNDKHKEQIEVYCDMCLKAELKCFPHIQTRQHKRMPSWKDNIQPQLEIALQKSWKYKINGNPKEGTIAEEMREARHRYHYAIRDVNRNEKNIRKAKMADCIAQDRTRDLWKEYGKVNGKKRKLPPHIDNNTQSKEINRFLQINIASF